MLVYHATECTDDERKCRECGLRTVPRILYLDKHCYCKSCAADLGLWDADDVDHEQTERFDEITLTLQEAQEEMAQDPYWRRRCIPPNSCYGGPWG